MPTPNGVNYLLQFLQYFFQFPNCPKQESKVDVQSYVLYVCYVTIRCYYFVTTMSLKSARCGIRLQI